jgi:DNA polymerase I-like protein with 3'-5' exonuclease and polymerase domains
VDVRGRRVRRAEESRRGAGRRAGEGDELAGWVGSFTKYKGRAGGSDEPNWLSIHRGDAIIYDRKTGEKTSVFVPHAAVSVCGGIQPGVLRRLASHGLFDSGMVARLVFAMPPRTPKTWSDDQVSPGTKAAADRSLAALYEMSAEVDEDGDPRPVLVGLTREARERLKAFVNEWGLRQFEAEGERAAALAKLEALPGRFALLHHSVLKTATLEDTDPMGLESLEADIRLARWCANEAERVYAVIHESAEDKEVRKLVELVARLAARHGGRLTVKVLQNANSRKYKAADEARADLERLVGLGLGRWEEGPTPGGREAGGLLRPDRGAGRPRPAHDARRFRRPTRRRRRDRRRRAVATARLAPDPGRCRPEPGSGDSGASHSPEQPSGESPPAAPERSSESSCVVHDLGTMFGVPAVVSEAVMSGAVPVAAVVQTPEALGGVAAAVRAAGCVGLDTETTGLSHAADRVRLLSLATPDGTFLVDLFRVDPAPLWPALADAEVVGHNLGFDLPFLMRLGFTPGRVLDTMLASQVLDSGDIATRHTLKDVAARTLGVAVDKELQAADWSGPLAPEMLRYAARDAELPPRVWEKLAAEADATGQAAVLDTEMRALPCVAWAAVRGVGFDRPAWEDLALGTGTERDRLREELDAAAPNAGDLFGVRNWDSPEQVREAFAAFGVALDSTADDDLAEVNHPLAARVREYRSVARLATTYGRDWLRHVGADGRVYASWRQIGAGASGRMSCSAPNLQQLPRDTRYRRCFVVPPGRVLVKADYSQIELRIAAKIAGDRRMLDAYRKNEDLHTLTARALLGRAEVTKADRQLAKAVNFGLLYGQGARGLRRYALANFGVTLSEAEAEAHRATFFRTYPGLRAWHRTIGEEPADTRTLAGRLRVGVRRYTEKLNTPVQGTGADGLKRALGLLWERRAECPGAVPVLFVHDEIVLECAESGAGAAADWLRRCMADGMAPLLDPVPVEVEVATGPTWGG